MSPEYSELETDRLKDKLKLYKYIALGASAFAVCFAILAIANINRSTESLVPPNLTKEAKIVNGVFDQVYLDAMKTYITSLALNVTPKNVNLSFGELARLVVPKAYLAFNSEMEKQAAYIASNNITQLFHESAVEYRPNRIIVFGTKEQFIGATRTNGPDECVFIIDYSNNHKFTLTNVTLLSKQEFEKQEAEKNVKN